MGLTHLPGALAVEYLSTNAKVPRALGAKVSVRGYVWFLSTEKTAEKPGMGRNQGKSENGNEPEIEDLNRKILKFGGKTRVPSKGSG